MQEQAFIPMITYIMHAACQQVASWIQRTQIKLAIATKINYNQNQLDLSGLNGLLFPSTMAICTSGLGPQCSSG